MEGSSIIKSVLFDMDGTLFNSEPLHAIALEKTFAFFGVKTSAKELERDYTGCDDPSIYKIYASKMQTSCREFLDKKNETLINLINSLDPTAINKLMLADVLPLLTTLAKEGKEMAVVSSSEREIVDHFLKRFSIGHFFQFTIPRFTTHFHKPISSPYLYAMRRMKVNCKDVIVFEDSIHGINAATEAGCRVIRVTPDTNLFSEYLRLKS